MVRQSPIFFQMGTKNVLIIDGNKAMQKVRARVLRSRGVHVHTAKSVAEAELLWVPDFFDLVLLDVRQRSKEAVGFWRMIRREHPGQRIRFLVGPPTYLSPTCADEVLARDRVSEDSVHQSLRLLPVALGLQTDSSRQYADCTTECLSWFSFFSRTF